MPEPRPISPTMVQLLRNLEELRRITAETERFVREANDGEAEAASAYRLKFATAYVEATGPTEMRRQLATIAAAVEHARLDVATGLRRSASEAADMRAKELETVSAAFHAYNRELKVEQQIVGAGQAA
jgi:hypothetical protein